ncbi:MAG: RNA-binding transcriptional accessory protein [Clostridia bacterium]|nr:RNA-binding transcriptional accessory protein [Clostridia bacterium]
MDIISTLTNEFGLHAWQVENTVKLIDEGNTIPFIARYRKEAHGSLDDQVLRELEARLTYLRNLEKRQEEVLASIDEQGKLTDELRAKIEAAMVLAEVEDLYRPYKQKRRTRAMMAKEKGLEPLAMYLWERKITEATLEEAAAPYVDPEKEVETVEDALAGASDIIAELISDDADVRKALKEAFLDRGLISSKAAKDEDSVYAQYYDFAEAVSKVADHRILALNRGEKEEFLKVSVDLEKEDALRLIDRTLIHSDRKIKKKNRGVNKKKKPGAEAAPAPAAETSPYNEEGCAAALAFVQTAAEDAYDRLIYPSVEREIRSMLKERADENAIKVFAQNLRPLLMAPPVKNKVVLALDPGYRMGCKTAVVDGTGKVLDTTVLYVTHGDRQYAQAKAEVKHLLKKHSVDVISIGNGTASKETEIFAAETIGEFKRETGRSVSYMVVSEAGASVYSASKLAAEEFPQYDVNLRSAISIGRRLQDPLAELVKIDPKAIGVGQYQHDMPQKELAAALDGVVEDCVNAVGADLNTASPALLAHIAGINGTIAKNIVAYREANGEFTGRAQLKKVPKLGPKAYEQCAGFLRVAESKNILDNTGVHPESYDAAKGLLEKCGYTTADVKAGKLGELHDRANRLGYDALAQQLDVGVPTLKDIEKELLKPGRDPRDELPPPMLRSDVLDIKDLKEGMELQGTVRNVIDFGAFVDIGVHQDGLVHISQISNKYIKHPSEVLSVGDVVTVRILGVDLNKQRISLTMKGVNQK